MCDDQGMANRFKERPELRISGPVTPSSLNEQERKALKMIGFGYDSRELAVVLGVTPRRASVITTNLKHLIGVVERDDLVAEAKRIFGLEDSQA